MQFFARIDPAKEISRFWLSPFHFQPRCPSSIVGVIGQICGMQKVEKV